MANTHAVILRDTRDGEESLPVALRTDLPLSTLDTGGAGRLLHHAYLITGHAIEKTLGRAAHKFGSGPIATSCRIKKALGDGALQRQSALDGIYDSFQDGTMTKHECLLRVLKKDCQKLLNYARPSRSLATQIDTFRNIIVLTTRYPGLRRIFLQSSEMSKVPHFPDAICELWRCTDNHYDTQSRFSLEFAAHCLAGHNSVELYDIRPSELGRTCKEGLGIVDTLLVRYCDGGSGFSRLIAIRYIAGILELPTFWSEDYESQKFTMDKLCKQALCLVEDINPDSLSADDIDRLTFLDPDGIDAFTEAVLVGGESWIQGGLPSGSHSWLTSFIKLVKVLRRLIIPDLLPMASRRAAENWGTYLKGITDLLRMSEPGDCQYQDIYVTVNERLGPQSGMSKPPRFIWAPSDIAEEPPSLLRDLTARIKSTFFGRTASKVASSNSLPGEEPDRGSYLRPDTPRDLVGGILAEEIDDGSTGSRPSSPLVEHVNAATRTIARKSAGSNVQERVPSLPLSSYYSRHSTSDHHHQPFNLSGDNSIRRTTSHGSHERHITQSNASLSASRVHPNHEHFSYQSQAGGPAGYSAAPIWWSPSALSSPVPLPPMPEGDRSFVGGFFKGLKRIPRGLKSIPNGLKRIPRVFRSGRDKRFGTEADPTTTSLYSLYGNTLPRYDSNPPCQPYPDNVLPAEAFPRLSGHVSPQLDPSLLRGRNPSMGEFTNLPEEWKQLLLDSRAEHPQAVMEIIKFYQEANKGSQDLNLPH